MSTQTSVLVADDEPDTLRGLERILGKEGYRVDAVGSGVEAAEKLGAGDYDVVVSDLKMPTVSGMDLLRMARDKHKGVVFVMVTGYGTPETASAAMKLGSSDFIAKPFAPSVLTGAIERGLTARRQEATPRGAGAEASEPDRSAPFVGGVPWDTVSGWIDEHGSEAALAAARGLGRLRHETRRRRSAEGGHGRTGASQHEVGRGRQ